MQWFGALRRMQLYCEKVIMQGREALKTYLAPRFQNQNLDIDIFEGGEFMFGADVCVAKQNRFHAIVYFQQVKSGHALQVYDIMSEMDNLSLQRN